jgi:hypothetical protein
MKTIKIKTTNVFVWITLALCYSCNDFLDVVPDNRTVLDSPDAVKQLLVDAYPGAHYFHLCEIMSDNAGERNTTASNSREVLNEEMYKWEDGALAGTGQDTPSNLWRGHYNAIASANQALQSIAEASDPGAYDAQRGEALLCRAYAHFILVNVFAEHYDPATADRTLGIPYNTEPENTAVKHYKRNTLAEVYERIEKDLTEGLALIDDKAYDVPKYHFTKAAAHAFASRFYLYKGDWDQTIRHADLALGDNVDGKILPLHTPAFSAAASEEYRIQYRRVDQPDVLLLLGASSWWSRDQRSSTLRYGMINNHRQSVYTRENIAGTTATYYRAWLHSASGAYYLYKHHEYFKYSYQGATTGVGYVMAAVLTIEEVLLNRAEAYVMKGGADAFNQAIADLSILLKKRINLTAVGGTFKPLTLERVKAYYDHQPNLYPDLHPFYQASLDADQMSMLKFVVDWRRKEFFLEGMRWFDIKRFHLEVVHAFNVTTPKDPAVQPIVLTGNDLRRAVQIPTSAQAFGVEKNPRQ